MAMEQAENKVLWRTCRQIAAGLGLSSTTTWRMLRRGDLPAIRAGRVWCIVPASVAPYVVALAQRGVVVRPVAAPTPKSVFKRHASPPPVDVAAQHAAVAEMVQCSMPKSRQCCGNATVWRKRNMVHRSTSQFAAVQQTPWGVG